MPLMDPSGKAGPADGPHRTCVAPCPELLSAVAGASLQPLPACVAGTRGLLNDRSGTDVCGCGQVWGLVEQAAGAGKVLLGVSILHLWGPFLIWVA